MALVTSNDSSSSYSYSSSISPLSSPSSSSIFYVDLYGKRRQIAKVQVLEREIGLIQEEIKSLAELELASSCCKEVDEYIEATPDPLITLNQIRSRSGNFWKNVRRKLGSMLCCYCCCCSKATTICCGCRPLANGSCFCSSDRQEKTRTPKRCNCSMTPCSKCSVCCCKPCSCF